jgi:hypothetical protein
MEERLERLERIIQWMIDTRLLSCQGDTVIVTIAGNVKNKKGYTCARIRAPGNPPRDICQPNPFEVRRDCLLDAIYLSLTSITLLGTTAERIEFHVPDPGLESGLNQHLHPGAPISQEARLQNIVEMVRACPREVLFQVADRQANLDLLELETIIEGVFEREE